MVVGVDCAVDHRSPLSLGPSVAEATWVPMEGTALPKVSRCGGKKTPLALPLLRPSRLGRALGDGEVSSVEKRSGWYGSRDREEKLLTLSELRPLFLALLVEAFTRRCLPRGCRRALRGAQERRLATALP